MDTNKVNYDKSNKNDMQTALDVCGSEEQVAMHEKVASEYLEKFKTYSTVFDIITELAFDPRLKSDVERAWLSFQLGRIYQQLNGSERLI